MLLRLLEDDGVDTVAARPPRRRADLRLRPAHPARRLPAGLPRRRRQRDLRPGRRRRPRGRTSCTSAAPSSWAARPPRRSCRALRRGHLGRHPRAGRPRACSSGSRPASSTSTTCCPTRSRCSASPARPTSSPAAARSRPRRRLRGRHPRRRRRGRRHRRRGPRGPGAPGRRRRHHRLRRRLQRRLPARPLPRPLPARRRPARCATAAQVATGLGTDAGAYDLASVEATLA